MGHVRTRAAIQIVHGGMQLLKFLGRRLRRDAGGVAVEFAFVMPILLMLLFGTIEIGRVLFADHTLSKAVRDGARYAIVRGSSSTETATESQIGDYVKAQALGLDLSDITVTVTFNPDNSPGSMVTVQADYSYDLAIFDGPIGPITLSATSHMTVFQ